MKNRKISTESSVTDDSLNVKVGTMDKKNPQIIYLEVGGYIMPLNAKDDYSEDIDEIFRTAKKDIANMISETDIASKDYIFVAETANDRIKVGKKSHIDIQISLRVSDNVRKANGNKFSAISKVVADAYAPCMHGLKQSIEEHGFSLAKSAK